jgi:hypothetical protein
VAGRLPARPMVSGRPRSSTAKGSRPAPARYVADFGSHTIRRITLSGQVSDRRLAVPADGSGSAARFNPPGRRRTRRARCSSPTPTTMPSGAACQARQVLTVVAAAPAALLSTCGDGLQRRVCRAYVRHCRALTATANAGRPSGWRGGCSGIGMPHQHAAASAVTATFDLGLCRRPTRGISPKAPRRRFSTRASPC